MKIYDVTPGKAVGKSYDGGRPDGMVMEGRGRQSKKLLKGHVKCNCNAPFSPGIVLDPFLGSGTVPLVAKRLGMDFVGIELNPEYVEMAWKRLEEDK